MDVGSMAASNSAVGVEAAQCLLRCAVFGEVGYLLRFNGTDWALSIRRDAIDRVYSQSTKWRALGASPRVTILDRAGNVGQLNVVT